VHEARKYKISILYVLRVWHCFDDIQLGGMTNSLQLKMHVYVVGGMAQCLGYRSLAGILSLIYA